MRKARKLASFIRLASPVGVLSVSVAIRAEIDAYIMRLNGVYAIKRGHAEHVMQTVRGLAIAKPEHFSGKSLSALGLD